MWFVCLSLLNALNVVAPTANQVIDISRPFDIIWTFNSSDPDQVSIDVVNATANQEYVLVNNVRGANVSEDNYTLRWANAIPSDIASYQLVFLDYATGGYVAQSPVFNLTLPAGETRNTSTGDSPASPGTASSENIQSSGDLSTGALIAAIVVSILVVVTMIAAGILFWRRKRRQQILIAGDEARKAELEGNDQGAVRYGRSDSPTLTSKHHSAELSGAKDLMKWELPTTPPRKSTNPVEMPAEVPLAELGAVDVDHLLKTSQDDTMVAESVSTEGKTSPSISQDGFLAHSPKILRNPSDVAFVNNEGATSTTGRSRFKEALYDILSDELRRFDAPSPARGT